MGGALAGLAPWKMWGGSTVLNPVSGGVVSTPVSSGQSARVNFGRPDSWAFLFFVQLGNGLGPGGSPVTPNGNIQVSIDLQVGIGRSLVLLPDFARFVFQWAGGYNANALGRFKWTCVTRTPVLDDQAATPDTPLIEHFPAEDIQASARGIMNTVTNGDTAQVTVTTLFAPRTHIRPEWLEGEFRGGEDQGS